MLLSNVAATVAAGKGPKETVSDGGTSVATLSGGSGDGTGAVAMVVGVTTLSGVSGDVALAWSLLALGAGRSRLGGAMDVRMVVRVVKASTWLSVKQGAKGEPGDGWRKACRISWRPDAGQNQVVG